MGFSRKISKTCSHSVFHNVGCTLGQKSGSRNCGGKNRAAYEGFTSHELDRWFLNWQTLENHHILRLGSPHVAVAGSLDSRIRWGQKRCWVIVNQKRQVKFEYLNIEGSRLWNKYKIWHILMSDHNVGRIVVAETGQYNWDSALIWKAGAKNNWSVIYSMCSSCAYDYLFPPSLRSLRLYDFLNTAEPLISHTYCNPYTPITHGLSGY